MRPDGLEGRICLRSGPDRASGEGARDARPRHVIDLRPSG
jgi:hypothetical protein